MSPKVPRRISSKNEFHFNILLCRFFTDESTIEVLAGAHDVSKNEDTQQRFRIKKLIVHPDYTGNNRTDKNGKPLPRELNDIALLELSEEIVENEFVKIARLPDKNVNKEDGKSAKIAGWGRTTEGGKSSNILLKGDVNIVDVDTCITKDNYERRGPYKASTLCASGGGTDSCQVSLEIQGISVYINRARVKLEFDQNLFD